MKKSFLVLICVVFLLSIVVVGVFGLKFTTYEDRIYTTGIVCKEYYFSGDTGDGSIGDSHEFKQRDDGTMYDTLPYTEGMQVVLSPQAYPLNATILDSFKEQPYLFNTTSTCASVDNKGVVSFTRAGTATILITPADGTSCSVTVILRAKTVTAP